jgi:hypothetical protein
VPMLPYRRLEARFELQYDPGGGTLTWNDWLVFLRFGFASGCRVAWQMLLLCEFCFFPFFLVLTTLPTYLPYMGTCLELLLLITRYTAAN